MTINTGAVGFSGWHKVRTDLSFKIENGNLLDMEVAEWDRG